MPVFKGQKYIQNIVDKVELNCQNLTDKYKGSVELLLVNDYPKEKLSYDIQRYNDFSIKIIEYGENKGIHGARIEGLNRTNGDFILFLDQDDDITANYLESQLSHIKDKDAVICNGIYRDNKLIYFNEEEQERAVDKLTYLKFSNLIISPGQVLLRKNSIPDFWKKNILKKNGGDDVLLWILMLKEGKQFAVNHDCLYFHNEDGNNTSLNFENMREATVELNECLNKSKLLDNDDLSIINKGLKKRINKYDRYIKIYKNWSNIIDRTKQLVEKKGYSKVAVYGMGVVGRKFVEDMGKNGINVRFFIDNKSNAYQYSPIKVYSPLDKEISDADVILVSATFDFEKIRDSLKDNVYCDIISIEDLV